MTSKQKALTPLWEAAIQYAKEGLHVFPIYDKKPLAGTRGFLDATDHWPTVMTWAGRYKKADCIGVATGPVSGIFVIDIDPDAGGRESIIELQKELGALPQDCIATTPSGGLHIHFAWPKDSGLRNTAGSLGPGVDSRAEGGYVGMPCGDESRVWQNREDTLPQLPEAWLKRLQAPKRKLSTTVRSGEKVPFGQIDNYLFSEASLMQGRGYSHNAKVAALKALYEDNCEQGPDGHTDKDFERLATSSGKYEADQDPAEKLAGVERAKSIAAGLEEAMGFSIDAAMKPEMILALSTLENADPGEWVLAKAVLRKHNMIRPVDAAIKKLRYEQHQAKIDEAKTKKVDGEPRRQVDPEGYTNNATGVWTHPKDVATMERILHVPLYVTARLKDVETGDERVSLAWKRDGQWHTTNCDASVVASNQRIVMLADHGLPVNSQNASQIVGYLDGVAAANPDIPVRVRTERTGWIGTNKFYPGAADDIEFDPRDQSFKHVLTPAGSLDEWAKTVGPLRERYPLLRLQLSASFAGPLLERVGARGFVVHLWGRSGSGKTVVLNCAASVWGGRKFVKSFMTTEYALMVNAAERTGLPLCINEKQLAPFRADRTIYQLVEGVSKGQGAKAGGTRAQLRWLSPILTNGESPITDHDSEQGTQTRAIEIAGEPIDDEALASSLYEFFEQHHGSAGPAFVNATVDIDPKVMREHLATIRGMLDAVADTHSRTHIAALATIALADYYSGMHIFEMDDTAALDSSIRWAIEFMQEHLPKSEDTDQGASAYDDICAFVRANLGMHFARTPGGVVEREFWGYMEGENVWILASELRRFIEGHVTQRSVRSYKAVLRDLDAKSLVRLAGDTKKRRYSIGRAGAPKYNVIKCDMGDS